MAKLAVTVKKPNKLGTFMEQQIKVAALAPEGYVSYEVDTGLETALLVFTGKDELNWKHNLARYLDFDFVLGVTFKYGNY